MKLLKQATEKRNYSTLETECFSIWLADFLQTEAAPKKKMNKNFEFKYQVRVLRL